MASLLDVNAKHVSVMDNTLQTHKQNTLIRTRMSLSIQKTQIKGYTNYVSHVDVLH